jgi:two-component system chemotaxis response regulator CheB
VSSAAPIRVLVVDDSPAQRRMLVAMLESDKELQVVGWAADGAGAVQTVARFRPNVIVMDLRMPVMDGVEAARQIMRATPVPIVLVTATGAVQDRALVDDAVDAGVLSVVSKPSPGADGQSGVRALLRTVKSMAGVKVVRRVVLTEPSRPRQPESRPRLVAIGASTGGPQTLQKLLGALPAGFPLPTLLVQHIAPGFEAGLVDWLRPQCAVPIQIAVDGARPTAPGIYVATAGRHLVVRGGVLVLTDDEPVTGHRPSATVLFDSVAREYRGAAVGVLLTGMGEDGAAGLRTLKAQGAITVAQDEATSIVFGMPAAAISMGVVDHVLSPERIASLLVELGALR